MILGDRAETKGNRLVSRERLLKRLDRIGVRHLNLFAAPAGFGKSTTIRQWTERLGIPVVWISLYHDDNDPTRLWNRIIQETTKQVGIGVQAQVALGSETGAIRPAIERLAEVFQERRTRLCLVLDDFHLVESASCLASVELAIERFPEQVSTVLVSRHLPDLPLQKYMGRGDLLRVGTADLAFDEAETESLLVDQQGIALDEELVAEICARTGGWPAALYLSSLWLQDNPDPAGFTRLVPHQEERIADYLFGEIIASLPAEVRDFLRQTSFLGWMSGELCDAACGRSDSGELLEDVCRTNQLVERDQGRPGWFRYHSLMRDLLLDQLKNEDSAQLQIMRRRAIDWFLEQQMIDAAAELAIEAGEFDVLADILEANHFAMGSSGLVATIWRWGSVLPGEILDQRPAACMAVAMAGEITAVPLVQIKRLVNRAGKFRKESPEDWTQFHETFWQTLNSFSAGEGLDASITSMRQAIEAADGIPMLPLIGRAYLARLLELAGETEEARFLAAGAVEDPDIEKHAYALVYALNTMALTSITTGRLKEAESWVAQAQTAVGRFGLQETRSEGLVQLAEASLALACGDMGSANRSITRAVATGFEDVPTQARVLLVSAKVSALRGQLSQAKASLLEAEAISRSCPDVGYALELAEEVDGLIQFAGSETDLPLEPLTESELRVLPLLESGRSRAEIAAELYLSVNTVKSHLRSVYRKLGASEREQVLARARVAGLI